MENETSSVIASTKSVPGMEPIQLPASFKGFNFSKGEDSSDIKLDFTFDAELAKLTEEKSEAKEVGEQMSQPMSMPNQTSRVTALQVTHFTGNRRPQFKDSFSEECLGDDAHHAYGI